jgi:predicted RNase H-like nuclease
MDGRAVLGVDACKAGWVGVLLDGDGQVRDVLVAASIAKLVAPAAESGELAVVGIDIPIGLPDGQGRAVDAAARKLLRGASSSVFPTPTRQALAEADHAAASARNLSLTGKGISRQSWGLKAKVMDVDGWLTAAHPFAVIEVHPELSFQAMANGRSLRFNKRSWSGVVLRQQLLHAHGIDIPAENAAGRIGFDDVADAGAAAGTAHRRAVGQAVPVLAGPAGVGKIWY